MKSYTLFFFILKAAILIQFLLIIAKQQTTDSRVYIITEILFKVALFFFIELFLFHKIIVGIEFEDKLIISFSGGLLFYDAVFNDLPKLIEQLKKHGDIPQYVKLPW
jgi:hypothetical protein